MHARTRDALACPDCRGEFRDEDGELACGTCGRYYEVEGGVPRLLPSEDLGAEWRAKQELGSDEYKAEPDPVSIDLAHRFARFADLDGLVLDVGCGVVASPPYHEQRAGRAFVGVDPLGPDLPRDFDFVLGIAERLPFKERSFDGAIAATMLDHVPKPAVVLSEIRRVLTPGGRLAVWSGIVDDEELRANALRPLALPPPRRLRELIRRHRLLGLAFRAYRHLVWNRARAAATTLRLRFARRRVVAEVYADRARYHFWFFEADDVLELLRQTGFRVLATERVDTPASGASLFVLAEPEQTG